MSSTDQNEFIKPAHAQAYLAKADKIPHRVEGEAVLLELLPPSPRRILDLGTGDGRLLALVKQARPGITGVALDFSPVMLQASRQRFAGDPAVTVVDHNLSAPLPDLGSFDVIVSSFAIHHLENPRKIELFAEIFRLLTPGGLFANLEHVASPTPQLHAAFYYAMGETPSQEDPSNRIASVEDQLAWLRQTGFADADCFWKWRELALLAGWKPGEKS